MSVDQTTAKDVKRRYMIGKQDRPDFERTGPYMLAFTNVQIQIL